MKGSRAIDLVGTFQPREISVEISLWNREEEGADGDGSSGDEQKDWRIDIQREEQRNGRQDQKICRNMEADKEGRLHKHWILFEIQRLKQLIKTKREQNDNIIQRNERRERSLPKNNEETIKRRNNNVHITEPSQMVESYIPNKETQWNMEKSSGREQVGRGAALMYDNQLEPIQRDYQSEIEVEMARTAREIKAIYYGLLRFEQVFEMMQDQAMLIRSDNTEAGKQIQQLTYFRDCVDRETTP
ncbi:MAG: hypothetical protein EZS28_012468 [Streblomastix strix]|uniref:Uncharacterized protein n=1 Tax=Streblomastix strix TaxID=222440 RepID=A0A5J4WCA1_9EUKA|nr:MAG: hypothetical protein EZS28_012468 [Streblomastix strix]